MTAQRPAGPSPLFGWCPPTPGSALRDGKLYLFDRKQITVLGPPWRDPRAWSRTESSPWRGTRPLLPRWTLVDSLDETPEQDPAQANFRERRRSAWRGWWRQVPAELRATLTAFERATWELWDLLNLLAREPRSLDLAAGSPALAVAVAANRAFRRPRPTQPRGAARRLIRLRQRDALTWLGFDDTASTARLVRRVPAREATVPTLLLLRERLAEPQARRLLAHHAPTIDPSILDLLHPDLVTYVGPELVEQLTTGEAAAETPPRASPARLLRDLLRMRAAQGDAGRAARMSSLAQLVAEHDVAVRRLRASRHPGSSARFGPPPVLGAHWLVPLTSAAALEAEGWEMGHCVETYADDVLRGTSYIYRVSGWGLDRSTLELQRSGTSWRIGQLLGRGNEPVDEPTWARVRRHLHNPWGGDRPTFRRPEGAGPRDRDHV